MPRAINPKASPAVSANNVARAGVEAVWERSSDSLRRFILRRVPRDDVDDVLQESFLRIQRGLAALKHQERILPWTFRIVRATVADYFRRTRPAATEPEILVLVGSDDRTELGGCAADMLESLPADYREAVRLVDWAGLPQQEAADRLGLSLSGAKSRVQRGRAKLRAALSL